MKPSRLLLTAILSLVITGCVVAPTTRQDTLPSQLVASEQEKQREIAIRYKLRQYERLYRVGYPLLRAADFLCTQKHKPGLGVILLSQYDFGDDYTATARRSLRLPGRLIVHYVIPDTPASHGGLRARDELVQVGSHVIGRDKEAETKLFRYLRGNTSYLPVDFQVIRDGRPLTLTVQPEPVCDFSLAIADSDSVNAMADGEHIILTKGMMRFAETDQELSLVVAHELAHNAMAHIDALRTNAAGGFILDTIAASAGVNTGGLFRNLSAARYSKEFESEADLVGLYIMARAGISLDHVADFWRRMAAEHPASISNDGLLASHPTSAERFIAIEQAVDEIRRKQDNGEPLEPDHRP